MEYKRCNASPFTSETIRLFREAYIENIKLMSEDISSSTESLQWYLRLLDSERDIER